LSFDLKFLKKGNSKFDFTIDALIRLYHEIELLDLKDPPNTPSSDWFQKVLLLNFITQLFLGFKFLNSVLNQENKDWMDLYSTNNDPFDVIINLRTRKFFLQEFDQTLIFYETNSKQIQLELSKINWGSYATQLTEDLKWSSNYYSSEYSKDIITFSIFEEIALLFQKKNTTRKANLGRVYTPYNLAEQISRRTIDEWLRTTGQEVRVFKEIEMLQLLDPAVGTGIFLIAAGNVIFEKLKEGNKTKSTIMIKKEIVEDILYGLDIDSTGNFISKLKLRLWILHGVKPKEINSFKVKDNLILGNSLMGYQSLPKGLNQNLLDSKYYMDLLGKIGIYQTQSSQLLAEQIDEIKRIYKKIHNLHSFQYFILEGNLREWNELKNNIEEEILRKIKFSPPVFFSSTFSTYAIFSTALSPEVINSIPELNPFCINNLFHWRSVKDKLTFDIIVGNPPFIALTDLQMVLKLQLKALFPEVYSGNSDYSYFFLYRMYNALKENGILGFLLPKYFQTSVYGQKIRKFLETQTTILEIHDFNESLIFPRINIHTSFLLLKNQKRNLEIKSNYYRYTNKAQRLSTNIKFIQSKLNNIKWTILPKDYNKLVSHILSVANYRLKDVSNTSKGIETGCDKIFAPTTPNFFSRHLKINPTHYKKWLKGKDIKQFHIDYTGREVLYAPKERKDTILSSEPTMEYLNQNKKVLLNRSRVVEYFLWREGDERKTMNWRKAKIVSPFKAVRNTFAIDFDGCLSSKDVVWIIPNQKHKNTNFLYYLVGLLNSNVLTFLAQCTFKDLGGIYDFYPRQIQDLPLVIPSSNSYHYKSIYTTVKLLHTKLNEHRKKESIKKMNSDIYRLYNIMNEDRELIESFVME
jgi:hypothetical protein